MQLQKISATKEIYIIGCSDTLIITERNHNLLVATLVIELKMASVNKGVGSMKQWVSHGKGGIDSLKLEEIAIPKPGENEVLVKIHAVSLNYRDLLILTVSRID